MTRVLAVSAIFEPLGGSRFLPTDHARGPWDPGALHGGPTSALLARAVEQVETGGIDLAVARLTIELLRPVPVAPLDVHAEVVRPGRKVQLVEASVVAGEVVVARARALRIRIEELALPADVVSHDPPAVGPDAARVEQSSWADDVPSYHRDGAELRFVDGTWTETGPARAWVRLRRPLVAGEEPTGLQRVAAAADFGNGISGVVPPDDWTYINPDLTIHLLRRPVGEWIGLDARTFLGGEGAGLAESVLSDSAGRLGRAVQSLLVDRR